MLKIRRGTRVGFSKLPSGQIKLGKSDSGKRKMTVAESANRVARRSSNKAGRKR